MAVIAVGWGLWMIFRRSDEDPNFGRWIGVAMVAGVAVVYAIFYAVAHEHS